MEQKTALVTGASRGIGKAIAIQLAKDGYNIILHYHKSQTEADEVKNIIEQLGKTCQQYSADLTKDAEVINMFADLAMNNQKIDVLINNAGFDYGYLFEDYTLEQMRYIIDIILWAKMTVTKYALPLLKNSTQASIVNISSRMGKEKTIKTISVYGPAQAGVIKFTQCCALEFADYKIRVNCLALGLTRTKLNTDMFIRDEGSEEKAEKLWESFAKQNPSGRVAEPQDAANLVSFLVSEKASYINGEIIGVNGGSNLV